MAGKWDKYGVAAESLFVEAGKTIDDLAVLLAGNVSRKTLGEWSVKAHWVAKRALRRTNPNAIITKLDASIADIVTGDEPLDQARADMLAKLSKTKERYVKDVRDLSLAKAIDTMSRYHDFVCYRLPTPAARDPHLQMISDFLDSLEEHAPV